MTTPAEAVDSVDGSAPGDPAAARSSLAVGVLRLVRPRQWVKNLLVFVAPGAAGVILHWTVLWHGLATFGIFCLAASGTYCINDTIDAEADRRHPVKRFRPVASGAVPGPLAVVLGVCLLALSVGLAFPIEGWRLAVVMASYWGVSLAYTLWLKHEPILDLVAVSAGFVLRAVAGGVATGVPLSNWFLIVTSFGSLLVVTGKRSGEQELLSTGTSDHGIIRATLSEYSASYLRSVRTLAAAVTVSAYCLWAFERAGQLHPGHHPIWFQLSIVPFVIALLHVLRLLDSGSGAAPEELALHDRRLQVYGLCWVALFAAGAYAR